MQDSALLPGSFYVASALRLFGRPGGRVRNAVFHVPVVLSADDTRLEVEARLRPDGTTEYAFREAGAAAATVEVGQGAALTGASFSADDFQAKAQATLDSNRYYAALRANGNECDRR